MTNIWAQVRLAGAVCNLVGACVQNMWVIALGFCLIGLGTVGGLDRLERLIAEEDNAKTEE